MAFRATTRVRILAERARRFATLTLPIVAPVLHDAGLTMVGVIVADDMVGAGVLPDEQTCPATVGEIVLELPHPSLLAFQRYAPLL